MSDAEYDPQDLAEHLDDDVTVADPGYADEDGLVNFPPDRPMGVGEELVSEPIIDSVESRAARTRPDVFETADAPNRTPRGPMVVDGQPLAGTPGEPSPEEAALHVIGDPRG